MSPSRPAAVVVLAAGEGKRMRSSTPKVLHEVGRPLPARPRAAPRARGSTPNHVLVVVGHGRDQVVGHLARRRPGRRGGRAGRAARHRPRRTPGARRPPRPDGHRRRGHGRQPAAHRRDTLVGLVAGHAEAAAAATVVTAGSTTPRATAASSGTTTAGSRRSSRTRDATPDQLGLAEVNSGVYAFDAAALRSARWRGSARTTARARSTSPTSSALLRADGRPVAAYAPATPSRCSASTTASSSPTSARTCATASSPVDARRRHRRRPGDDLGRRPEVELAPDVTLLPGIQLHGAHVVASGARVGPDSTLRDTLVGERAVGRAQPRRGRRGRPPTPRSDRSPSSARAPAWPADARSAPSSRPRTRDRRGLEGAAPVLRRRRRHRRGHQHRRRDGLRELRRRRQAPRPSSATTCGSAATPCSSPR